MKKIFVAALFSAGACGLHGAIVKNGGFEQDQNGNVEGWQPVGSVYTFKKGAGRNGTGALMFESAEPNASRYPRQVVELKPGRAYRYEVWVRTEFASKEGGSATICLEWQDEKGRHLGGAYTQGVKDATDWKKLEGVTPVIPPNARNIRVSPIVGRGQRGRAWFDDLMVEQFEKEPVGVMTVSSYQSMAAEGEVRFCVALELFPEKFERFEDLEAVFTFRDAEGNVCREKPSVFTRERAELGLDVKRLAMGAQTVSFGIVRRGGAPVGVTKAAFTRVASLPRRAVRFDRFNRTIVHGKPFFPLGMYWANPVTKDDMEIYAKGPFNCLMPYRPLTDETVELCRKHGMMTCGSLVLEHKKYVPADTVGDLDEKTWTVRHISRYKDHPSLLAWYTNDERPPTELDSLVARKRIVEETDPGHPSWTVVYQYSQVRDYLPSFDVIGTDPYPVPAHPLTMVSDWTRATRLGSYGVRPIWQVPQTFDWAAYRNLKHVKDRAPTAEEISTMTWLCIAEGANGIFFYSFQDLKKMVKGVTFDERWSVVCKAAQEVKDRFPVLLADPAEAPKTPAGVSARAWLLDGVKHILVVNGTKEPVEFALGGIDGNVLLAPGEHKFLR